jgi:hypothetical protein
VSLRVTWSPCHPTNDMSSNAEESVKRKFDEVGDTAIDEEELPPLKMVPLEREQTRMAVEHEQNGCACKCEVFPVLTLKELDAGIQEDKREARRNVLRAHTQREDAAVRAIEFMEPEAIRSLLKGKLDHDFPITCLDCGKDFMSWDDCCTLCDECEDRNFEKADGLFEK